MSQTNESLARKFGPQLRSIAAFLDNVAHSKSRNSAAISLSDASYHRKVLLDVIASLQSLDSKPHNTSLPDDSSPTPPRTPVPSNLDPDIYQKIYKRPRQE